jgi:CheY-like chemotaxis protein
MAQKRALVVDDSKPARVALQKLLEKHDIAADFAESGEEAIEFLKHHPTDAIFMDHTMPGMDGFEAVSVIKSDPRTAMIPVMMYTAKEGEVYVGQARALGAVGVLPKDVKPGALFDMLLKLGLVQDRRATPRRRVTDLAPSSPQDDADRLFEKQALGMSIQALITRILQDQHLELRSDILAGNRDFARRVAEEIHAKQQAEAILNAPEPPPRGVGWGVVSALLLLALVPLVLMFLVYSQAIEQRDGALAENMRLRAASTEQSATIATLRNELASSIGSTRDAADERYLALVEGLEWAANQGNQFGYGELPFNDARLVRLEDLLERLNAIGFSGRVRLDAHVGEFCLDEDGAGGYRLADPDSLLIDCAFVGHPLGASASLAERQSVAFANFLSSSPLLANAAIDVEVFARSSRDSTRRYPFPSGVRTAGEWNQVAAMNNRVEVTLVPR